MGRSVGRGVGSRGSGERRGGGRGKRERWFWWWGVVVWGGERGGVWMGWELG